MAETKNELKTASMKTGLEKLIEDLTDIRRDIMIYSLKMEELTTGVNPIFKDGATNLLQYLALRRRDLRQIQSQLAVLGLSSLGRSEAHVLENIDVVLKTLYKVAERQWINSPKDQSIDLAKGRKLLKEHTELLLGPTRKERAVRIMVTMPGQAADDYNLVKDLFENGMDCVRINCAHDGHVAWSKMIANVKRASEETGRQYKILMDLAGPKIRTGKIEPGEKVVKIKPERNLFGKIIRPARFLLVAKSKNPPEDKKNLPFLKVPQRWLKDLKTADKVVFKDSSETTKSLIIKKTLQYACEAETSETCYITPGTVLVYRKAKGKAKKAPVGDMNPMPNSIPLTRGDLLILKRNNHAGKPAVKDVHGNIITPAEICSTLPEVLRDVRIGDEVWFDDGKIGGIIESINSDGVAIRISLGREKARLKADKGINLPTSDLRVPSISKKDIKDLEFIADNADMVALSFARSAADIDQLKELIAASGKKAPAIVIKVETRLGFENLPAMLLSAMSAPSCGVMIARGDLAVECGFERLAEVQEEILWLCEAAHVPVIWATQVLENMTRDGIPSRAEITDAAMGNRAECVMLNKGPYIINAVKTLDDILKRMQGHQSKKQAMLRELKLAYTLMRI